MSLMKQWMLWKKDSLLNYDKMIRKIIFTPLFFIFMTSGLIIQYIGAGLLWLSEKSLDQVKINKKP